VEGAAEVAPVVEQKLMEMHLYVALDPVRQPAMNLSKINAVLRLVELRAAESNREARLRKKDPYAEDCRNRENSEPFPIERERPEEGGQ
jgi:hypothetical protein